ncbi:MAG: 16S rRNA (cytosine(1402)-N(4))-methyltransferase RsmH [Candidatus Omnitrophica bacterium]|jgi:16S rRNA (cytosine1402-N4)-methyltransferase|nr:16S rRNA (cytosine(1402)-N(4))-methyltransferase RsmH [Candidatus Omnitrophota bacterium]
MLQEAIDYLNLAEGKIIVDATVGTGGHSIEIAGRIGAQGKLIALDRDQESLALAKERLQASGANCEFVHGNFTDLDTIFKKLKVKKADGILFDLGISSYQLRSPERGFSFQNEGPLDMRMDQSSYVSAYDLINNLNQDELSGLLWNFGQERWHNRIARFLVQEREIHPISTTQELSNIIVKAIPYRYRHQRIHPATRTFQAVRIAVNRELEVLDPALDKAIGLLNKGGRICVISFHSLEDRIVKLNFKKAAAEGLVNIITPKPLVPEYSEVRVNPLSRSAKFRVAEKI